mmetsp:Transcript_4762/g.11578  ORF Transcript_4762/g.11578 Transcript_4762/m.11578 type:complete len:299 (+) Transcript_4762:857-1753(+)
MPPCKGACSMVRDRVWTPPPQDLVHWDHGPNCVILQSTGQALMLHFLVTSRTGHLASADGFAITSRFRVCTPPLQDAEQGPRIHLVTSHSFTLLASDESALKISSRNFKAASMVFSTLFILAQQAPTPLSTAPLISLYSSSLLFKAVASTVDWAEASANMVLKSSSLSRVSRMSTVFAARICSQFVSALARRIRSSSAASLTLPCTVAMLSTRASHVGLSSVAAHLSSPCCLWWCRCFTCMMVFIPPSSWCHSSSSRNEAAWKDFAPRTARSKPMDMNFPPMEVMALTCFCRAASLNL